MSVTNLQFLSQFCRFSHFNDKKTDKHDILMTKVRHWITGPQASHNGKWGYSGFNVMGMIKKGQKLIPQKIHGARRKSKKFPEQKDPIFFLSTV